MFPGPSRSSLAVRNSRRGQLAHEKKNYGFAPNLDLNPLLTRFNFTECLHAFREYAANQGRREQVSMLSI